jgi:hypothetical protein
VALNEKIRQIQAEIQEMCWKMVKAFGLSTNVMSKNVHRDKEREKTLKAITSAMEIMEITVSSGWLAPEKLKATDRQAIELEIENQSFAFSVVSFARPVSSAFSIS